MGLSTKEKEQIMQSLESLPPGKVKAVLDFIDYLKVRGSRSGIDAFSLILQQQGLAKIWEGEEEDLYEL